MADSTETQRTDQRLARVLEALRHDPTLPGRLADPEADIVRQALEGQSIYEIAQAQRMPEAAVWEVLGNAARAALGEGVEKVETGGLGAEPLLPEPPERDE